MKKRDLSIIALWIWSATQCFGQDPNFNTTYGGVVQDANTNGKYTGNPAGIGFFNSAFGFNALGAITSSPSCNANCAFGYAALFNAVTPGDGNTAIGTNAATNLINGFQNTTTGMNSLFSNSSGFNNCAYGYNSMNGLTSGSWNCAFGIGSMLSNSTGINNVAVGAQSQNQVSGGASDNTSVGYQSFFSPAAGSQFNTAIGEQAMYSPLGSVLTNNTAVGHQALFTSGGSGSANNTAIGYQALFSNQTGSNNIALGYLADVTSGTLTNATAIGANAKVANNNSMELGDNSVNVGIGLSGITPGPQNKLEISAVSNTVAMPCSSNFTSTFSSTLCTTNTGLSGLQFRDLTHASAPYPYSGNSGFLTVDDNGNVVLMHHATGNGIGAGYCSNGPLPILTSNAGYDLHNTANFYFAGNNGGTGVNNVNIGYNCSTPNVLAKLNVLQQSGGANSIGILVRNTDAPAPGSTPIGIKAAMPLNNVGSPSVAGWFEANHSIAPGHISYAIFVPPASGSVNGTGVVSIGYPLNVLPTYSLNLGSNAPTLLFVAGDISAIGYRCPSDRKFKTNFSPLKNALEKIKAIHPCYYYFDTVKYSGYQFPGRKQVGFIAQNVDSVMPEVVKRSDNGYSMDYSKMTPLLLAGIQEQQEIITRNNLSSVSQQKAIDSLRTALIKAAQEQQAQIKNQNQTIASQQQQINELKAMVQAMAGMPSGNNAGSASKSVGNTVVAVSDKNIIVLNQNSPNPFSESTVISYNIPNDFTKAQISISTIDGRLIQTVNITAKGQGSITVFASDLSAGTYSYTLTVDGKVIDTKKMMKD